MKQILILTLFLFSSQLLLYSQNKTKTDSVSKASKKDSIPKVKSVFIDENMEYISKTQFNQKCNAAVFYCSQYQLEELTAFKVYHKMYFGQLKPNEYDQLRLYLNKRSNKKIPENHNILIHYEESLAGFKESNENCNLINSKSLKENYEAYNRNAKNNDEYYFTSIKEFQRYVRSHRLEYHDENKFKEEVASYAAQQNNCIKKVELKYETPVFYVVGNNYNYPIKNKHFTWVLDTGTIKNTFISNHPNSDFILVKPNGEYFLKSEFMPDFVLKKLLKQDNWEQLKKNWNRSIKSNSPYGFGIVNDMTKEYEYYTSNCY